MTEEKKPEFKAADEELVLRCGNCAWMKHIDPPENRPDLKGMDLGFCYFNPPAVFPMPKNAGNLALQQQHVEMIPRSFRPPVDGKDNMCGRYYPDDETLKILDAKKAKTPFCDGCIGECKGDCNG